MFDFDINTYFDNKSYRFFGGGTSAPKIQTLAPAATPIQRAPTPQKNQEELERKNADIRRQRIMSKGRQGTLLTEKINEDTGLASLLGRSV
jgi:hypothetical protein